MTEITHQTVITSLDTKTRKALLERSDFAGIKQAVSHFGLILICSLYIYLRLPLWPIFLVVQGILLVFLFTALHETIHRSAFKTAWMNSVIAHICGFIIFLPAQWFKHFHFAHHRYTNQAQLDPELVVSKPQTLFEYFKYLSGIPVGISLAKTIFINAMNKNNDSFVASSFSNHITNEARVYLSIYALLAFASVVLNTTVLLWLWLIPMALGQPFLRAYLLAEHALCPDVDNMLINSRTTLTNALIRFIAWNMPYHAEHNSLPSVPFHKLPELHRHLKEYLGTVENGYIDFHKKMIKDIT